MASHTSYYILGNNRVVYKSILFVTGLTVTARMWDPDLLTTEDFDLTELSNGLYYFTKKFSRSGIYPIVFFENGTEKAFHTIRVKRARDF